MGFLKADLLFHVINKDIDFCYLEASCFFHSIANLVDNALNDSRDIDAIGNSNVQVNDQTAANIAHLYSLILCLIFFRIYRNPWEAVLSTNSGNTKTFRSSVATRFAK